jgi:hypothetical protein
MLTEYHIKIGVYETCHSYTNWVSYYIDVPLCTNMCVCVCVCIHVLEEPPR